MKGYEEKDIDDVTNHEGIDSAKVTNFYRKELGRDVPWNETSGPIVGLTKQTLKAIDFQLPNGSSWRTKDKEAYKNGQL